MSRNRKIWSSNVNSKVYRNVKKSLFTITFALGILSYSPITLGDSFLGPTELSSKEFKDLDIKGNSRLSEIKADSLTVKGPLDFKKLMVKGNTDISGPTSGEEGEFSNVLIHGSFWGSKIKIDNLHVDGEVALEDFKITGTVNINGPLKAKNGSFNDINTVHVPVQLYNVNVNNITVKKNRHEESGPNGEVKLAGNTIVSGNITFESGNGVVWVRDKTAQIKGKVIGGKIRE